MSTDNTQDSIADDWAQALEEQSITSAGANDGPHVFDANATPIPSGGAGGNPMHDIQMVLDIPVQLSVELGRTRVPIKYILQLAQGSIVELDALAGEPMDVLVNGYLIAQGEVVVVNDKFGIRLTDIVTPSERMKKSQQDLIPPTEYPDMLQNAMPALLLLALMVGMAFALKWARRRLPGIAGHSGPALRVLSSLSLGPQQRVVTVQVGDGADRICLVLGVASGSVTALHQMPLPADLPAVPVDPAAPATGFAARLSQLMKAPNAPR